MRLQLAGARVYCELKRQSASLSDCVSSNSRRVSLSLSLPSLMIVLQLIQPRLAPLKFNGHEEQCTMSYDRQKADGPINKLDDVAATQPAIKFKSLAA